MKNVNEVVANPSVICGIPNLELADVLQVLTGVRVNNISITERLATYGARFIATMTLNELIDEGLTKGQATKLLAAMQFHKKLYLEDLKKPVQIKSQVDVAMYLMDYFIGSNMQQEQFILLCLDTKNQVTHFEVIFQGSLNSSIVHPREVFNIALRYNAASIIVSHNHPSGNPEPSPNDIDVTKRLQECGVLMGIELVDHIIIGGHKFLSLREKGYM